MTNSGKGQRIGYARVSTKDQSLDTQISLLKGKGQCDKIYSEKITGSAWERPQLQRCLDFLREGDVLVVKHLDRLARDLAHLCRIKDMLEEKGAELVVLKQDIDTTTPAGKLTFHLLGAVAQFEKEMIKERQREGIARARAQGKPMGRAASLNDEQVALMMTKRDEGASVKELMAQFGISKASFYNYRQRAAKAEAEAEAEA